VTTRPLADLLHYHRVILRDYLVRLRPIIGTWISDSLADEYTYELTEGQEVFRNPVCPSVILVNLIKTCKYGVT